MGSALWDGLIYPFRKNKLIRSIILTFLYSILMYYTAILLVFSLMDVNSNIPVAQKLISDEIYTILISVFYYVLFALFIGYLVTVIQQSLKDNNKLPKFENLKKLMILGIKASFLNIIINIIPESLFKLESVLLSPVSVLNQFFPAINNIEHWIILGESNNFMFQPSLVIYQLLLSFSVWFISPAIYVTFSRRGRLSDLLPLKQYVGIYEDWNYIRIVLITFLVFRIPSLLIDYYAQIVPNINSELYYFVGLPILSSSFYIYLSIVMNRIIGKQWKMLKKCRGNRKLLCDTTVQQKLDRY